MAVKIKLKRLGKTRQPYYRIVVADGRTKRDGRAIEEIGKYHPKNDPSVIEVDSERVQYWLRVGAQPTEAVAAILRVTGDWQRFRGEPAPEPMKVAQPRADKRTIFAAAAKEALGEPGDGATTPRKRAAKKVAAGAPAAEAPAADTGTPETPATGTPAADAPVAEVPPADTPAADGPPTSDTAGSTDASIDAISGAISDPGTPPRTDDTAESSAP